MENENKVENTNEKKEKKYSEIFKEEIKKAFDLIDFAKKGTVNLYDVLEALEKMEYKKKDKTIYDFFKSFERKTNKNEPEPLECNYTYDDFLKKIDDMLKEDDNLDNVGLMYDIMTHEESGKTKPFMDLTELKKMNKDSGANLSEEDLKLIINNVGNGEKIKREDFVLFISNLNF